MYNLSDIMHVDRQDNYVLGDIDDENVGELGTSISNSCLGVLKHKEMNS